MTTDRIRALELSNAELRAALTLAGKELVKHGMRGQRNQEILKILRRAIRDSRSLTKAQGA